MLKIETNSRLQLVKVRLLYLYFLVSITKFYKDNHCHWVVDKKGQRNYLSNFIIILLLWKCQIQFKFLLTKKNLNRTRYNNKTLKWTLLNRILKVFPPLYLRQIFECYVFNLYSFFIIFKYLLVLSIFLKELCWKYVFAKMHAVWVVFLLFLLVKVIF